MKTYTVARQLVSKPADYDKWFQLFVRLSNAVAKLPSNTLTERVYRMLTFCKGERYLDNRFKHERSKICGF